MAYFKSMLLLLLLSTAINTCSFAQQNDMQQFRLQDSLLKDNITLHLLNNQVFSNAIIGNYQVGETGITTANGHDYFIRIQEPDRNQVIPMPGADLKYLENPQPLNQSPIPFRKFPTTPTPPIKY